ncbi:hypothetical protein VHUM_00905 [Vanrija humicola]|uniref:Uncharacterized protein n=1 Tax=Vanrija humicola TaxID=5417 RepID=A0A7D8V4P8_VANHU|nr:hypothetical protein VHUM_00905 [Vanrija humicola]
MQASRRAVVAARTLSASAAATRASSSSASASTTTPPPRPKRPSPYRLPHLPAFLSAFAPLHASGWRLDRLPGDGTTGGSNTGRSSMLSGADLQGRVLVRAFAFPRSRAGWAELSTLSGRIARAVEAHDVAPLADLPPAMRDHLDTHETEPEPGYVIHVATHTHTPLPPLPLDSDGGAPAIEFEGKPRPGVTGKDLRLADAIEKLWAARSATTQDV